MKKNRQSSFDFFTKLVKMTFEVSYTTFSHTILCVEILETILKCPIPQASFIKNYHNLVCVTSELKESLNRISNCNKAAF